jgi:hypothetical protein
VQSEQLKPVESEWDDDLVGIKADVASRHSISECLFETRRERLGCKSCYLDKACKSTSKK